MPNYAVIGLSWGDEGKGATVDYLCATRSVDVVVRFNGGFQAAHNVCLPDGRHHIFSQFGSGTLRGVATYVDKHVIVHPGALHREAKHLESLGVQAPMHLIRMHPDCLVSTIYHRRLCRLMDDKSKDGSCGVGIGAVRQMWSETGDGISVSDLKSRTTVKKKLSWVRQWVQDKLVKELYSKGRLGGEYYDVNIDWNRQPISLNDEVNSLYASAANIYVRDPSYLKNAKSVIFEGSQGFALDEVYGTIPHTTYSNTRPTYALELCEEFGLDKPKVLGIIRPYETRHGNGPMFKEYFDNEIDVSKDHNFNNGSFAGTFRIGALDTDAINKAFQICQCDSLAVNCVDHVCGGHMASILPVLPKVAITSYGPTSNDRVENEIK